MLHSSMQQMMEHVKVMLDQQRAYFETAFSQRQPTPSVANTDGRQQQHTATSSATQMPIRTNYPHQTFRPSDSFAHDVTIVPYGHTPVSKWQIKFSGLPKKDDQKSESDVNMFIERVEELMEAHRVNNIEIIEKINLLLMGPAHIYWQELRRQGVNGWAELKTKFLKRFANLTEDNLRSEIYSRRQKSDERTLDFIYEMCGLINRLPSAVDEHTRLQMIYRGMDDRVTQLARARAVTTVDQLADYIVDTFGCNDAPNCRSIQNAYKPKFQFPYRRTNETAQIDEEQVEFDECEIATVHRFLSKFQNSSGRKKADSIEKVSDPAKSRCWNCDAEGHNLQNCLQPKTRLICYGCGRKDETITTCAKCSVNRGIKTLPTNNNTNANGNIGQANVCEVVYDVHTFNFAPLNDPRPHAQVKANGFTMSGLLDTGAHATVLGYNQLNDIEQYNINKKLINASVGIRTADGTVHKAMGIVKALYEYDGRVNEVQSIVMATSSKKLLLGIDFMAAFDIRLIDFGKIKDERQKAALETFAFPINKSMEMAQAATVDMQVDEESHPTKRLHNTKTIGPIGLWEFVIEIATNSKEQNVIKWHTSQEFEFVDFKRFVILWSERKGRPITTAAALTKAIKSTTRALRYYNQAGDIIVRVERKSKRYRFSPTLVVNGDTNNPGQPERGMMKNTGDNKI